MTLAPVDPQQAGWESPRDLPSFSNASLAPVWQLNAFFLETLIQCSRHPTWRGSAWEVALGPSPDRLPSTAREELARCATSLVDVGLDRDLSRILCEDETCGPYLPAFLPRGRASHLAQATLSLAWTLARKDTVATSIIFGLSQLQAKALSALTFHSIPAISERLASAVQPRWLRQPRIWQRLLSVAERPTAARLAPIHARVLQRQFFELLLATSATHFIQGPRP